MIAVDKGNNRVWFGRNGTWLNSGNPATNSNGYLINTSPLYAIVYTPSPNGGTKQVTANFGNAPFQYTVPTGFTAGWGN
jgi:hypothetical protein